MMASQPLTLTEAGIAPDDEGVFWPDGDRDRVMFLGHLDAAEVQRRYQADYTHAGEYPAGEYPDWHIADGDVERGWVTFDLHQSDCDTPQDEDDPDDDAESCRWLRASRDWDWFVRPAAVGTPGAVAVTFAVPHSTRPGVVVSPALTVRDGSGSVVAGLGPMVVEDGSRPVGPVCATCGQALVRKEVAA